MNKIEKIKNYVQMEFSKEKFLDSWFFIKSEVKEIIFYPNFKKHFVFLYLLYLAGYTALLRANIDYQDDILRSFDGYIKWDNYSRYLSNFFSHFLHMGWNLLDQSPINQLIAIGIVSLSSVFLTRIFFKEEEISYWHLIASLPIGLSPFFLQNMAYKYDSPYMALSVLASIFPYLFIKNKLAFYIVGILSLLITLTTYQAGHQVFIVLAIFLLLNAYLEDKTGKEIKELIFNIVAVFIIAILLFQIFINHSYDNKTDKISTFLFLPNEMFMGIYINLKRYFTVNIYQSFKGTFFLYLLLTSCFLAVINIKIRYKNFKKIFSSLLFLLFAAFTSLGLFILVEKAELIFYPRTQTGFSMFLVGILFLLLANKNLHITYINKSIISLFCYNLLIISNIFGNALKVQMEYYNYRVASAIYTLNNDSTYVNNNLNKNPEMIIKFQEKFIAPQLHNNMKYMPVLRLLVSSFVNFVNPPFYEHNNLKYGDISQNGKTLFGLKLKLYRDSYNCSLLSKEAKINKVSESLLHKITYYSNNCIELEFK